MSDRVENMLIILGPRGDREQFQRRARGKLVNYKGEQDASWKVQPLCFHNFAPVPDHLVASPRWRAESPMGGTPEDSGGVWEQKYWGCKYGPIKMGLDI